MRVRFGELIAVASSDPAELQRATQLIADALAEMIRPAPEDWYSFKPIWPPTDAESADLERRGLRDDRRTPGPGAGPRLRARRSRRPRPRWRTRDVPRPSPARDLVAGLPAARGTGLPLRRLRGRPVVPLQAGPRGPGPPQPAARLSVARGVRSRRSPGPCRRHRPEGARAPRPLLVPARRALLPRGGPEPVRHAGLRRRAPDHGHARAHRRGGRARQGRPLRRTPLRLARARGHLPRVPRR